LPHCPDRELLSFAPTTGGSWKAVRLPRRFKTALRFHWNIFTFSVKNNRYIHIVYVYVSIDLMAPGIKVRHKHSVLVILDADQIEDFKKAIAPLGISDYFRQEQYNIVEEYN